MARNISEQSWRKGPWTPEEDKLLLEYVSRYGDGRWSCVSKCAGLNRSGKSCRLRWVNYLRPGLKKGHITPQEEGIIIELHALWGNKWSTIARYLPGRTDNEIKNYWRTHFKKRKNQCQKQQEAAGKENKSRRSGNLEASSDDHGEEEGKKETVTSESTTSLESDHHQLMMPVTTTAQQVWSDFVPVENYLFGGLWNLDDQNGCSTMAIQNQAGCSRGGGGGGGGGGDPAVTFMCSSANRGYIF